MHLFKFIINFQFMHNILFVAAAPTSTGLSTKLFFSTYVQHIFAQLHTVLCGKYAAGFLRPRSYPKTFVAQTRGLWTRG